LITDKKFRSVNTYHNGSKACARREADFGKTSHGAFHRGHEGHYQCEMAIENNVSIVVILRL